MFTILVDVKKSRLFQTTWNSTILLVLLLLLSVGESVILILKVVAPAQFFIYPFSFAICFTFLSVIVTAYLKLVYKDNIEYS